ncbi:MAG: phosphatidate cytidylyltransferase [Eubacteriales bacterium]|nr:phosphatidate cytidylyltransferase [Eubacteriales bacterium]
MSQRILTGVLFTIAIIAFMLPGFWLPFMPLIMFAIVSFLSRQELDRALQNHQLKLPPVLSQIGAFLFLLPLLVLFIDLTPILPGQPGAWQFPAIAGYAFLMTGLVIWSALTGVLLLIREGPEAMPRVVVTAATYFYVVLPLGTAVLLLYFIPRGWYWLVMALIATWVSDVFAFFVGVTTGKHKIVPRISPKKSIEGSLGGLFGGVLTTLVMFPLIAELPFRALLDHPTLLSFALLSGIALSAASQLGDWMASGIKRWCDVKDFGNWLPGHGGMLDRFDGILFTLPMTFLLAALVTLF